MKPYGMRLNHTDYLACPCCPTFDTTLGRSRARAESKREVATQLDDDVPVFEMDEWCQCPMCDERHCVECGACLECEACGPVLCCGCDPPAVVVAL